MQYIFLFINLKIFLLMDKVLHNQFDICPKQNSYLDAISKNVLCKIILTRFVKTV